MKLNRRDFLKMSAIAAAVAGLGAAPATVDTRNGMPYRILGKTGEKVSILGVGGSHIGTMDEAESIRLQRTAIDEGVNFFDNAYIYNDGRSEELMGKALRDGYRDKVFLMTKFYSDNRDAETAMRQLEESLRRLQTDRLDLWQVHQIHKPEHPRLVYENLIPVLDQALKDGKARYIGFTGHTRPEFHLEMLERGYEWQTVQMPVNALDYHWTSFQGQVMPKLQEKNIGIIGMKSLGGSPGQIPNNSKALTAAECLRYSMNQPIATLVSGMDSMDRLRENLAVAKAFQPMSDEEVGEILAKARQVADGGQFEPYKWKTLERRPRRG